MPLIARALTTVPNVKVLVVGKGDAIPSDHDLFLEFLINAATDEVERFCRRTFLKTTYTNESYVAAGGPRLYLHQWPIVTLTKVDDTDDNGVTWTLVPAADYYVAPELDLELKSYLVRPDGWSDGRDAQRGDVFTNRVTYEAGYVLTGTGRNLPYDLERAVGEIVLSEYLYRGRPAVTNESFGGLNLNFSADRWPLGAKDTLRRYRPPRL